MTNEKHVLVVEATHSRWGKFKTVGVRKTYQPGTQDEPLFRSYHFFRADSGTFLGELDQDKGGMLGHPSNVINKFLESYDDNLLDFDYDGYVELEGFLLDAIEKHDPTFFNKS